MHVLLGKFDFRLSWLLHVETEGMHGDDFQHFIFLLG
jgi:hypothetical protein